MKKIQIYALGLFSIFLLMALIIDKMTSTSTHLKHYADDIEAYIAAEEGHIQQVFRAQEQWWRKIFEPGRLSDYSEAAILRDLRTLKNQNFGIYFYLEDSLVFWSRNNFLPPPAKEIKQQVRTHKSPVLKLGNGYYLYYKNSFSNGSKDIRYTIALLPLKQEFKLESAYLKQTFEADQYIPEEIQITFTPTDYPVLAPAGNPLFYLTVHESFKDVEQLHLILLCYILAAFCFITFINSIARDIVQHYRPWWGAAFLIGTIVSLRLLSFHFEMTQKFENLPIFNRTFNTPVLSYSLGDLLIDVLLLLWLMIFFHREFRVKKLVNISRLWQSLLTTLNYFSIILGILMIISVFKSLVLDSGITFDFDNVFRMDIYSIMAIFAVIFLLFALFLFSHRMMLTIQMTGMSKRLRLTSLSIALLGSVPVIWLTDLQIAIYLVVLTAGLYILLFDMYIENTQPSLTWLGIWIVFFASFSAVLLFKYNEDKDLQQRLSYAKELAEWKDTLAEQEFKAFTQAIAEDTLLARLLFDDERLNNDLVENEIIKRIDNQYANFNYLFNIYTYRFALGSFPQNADTSDIQGVFTHDKNHFLERLKTATSTAYHDIFLWSDPDEWFSYLAPVNVQAPPGMDQKGRFIYFEIKMRLREPSMIYTELILTQHFKKLNNLDHYDYAIYKNGKQIEQNTKIYEEQLGDFELPERGTHEEKIFGNRSELIYQAPDGTVVIIGRAVRNLIKPISLFSYLFVLLILTVILLATVNTFTRILPEVLQLTIWRRPSLKNKIQLSIIAVIILSFVMIGWVTVIYFKNTSNDYHENRLFRKLASVLMDAEHEIQIRQESGQETVNLQKLVSEVSPIHRMDINIYDLQGNLVTSTEMDIFNKGIVAPKMGTIAYHAIARGGAPEIIQEEKIGNLDYKAAYVPLRMPNGKVMGYVGLPYYSKQRNLRDDVTDFMGTLLNVYVFLLLIASIIAIFVANSISKPIGVIGERFKRFKLGNNEPLEWESKDELGELIADYNRMIVKVEESTTMLKKSEREGAWRVMAQQVAHEIKNPLTPMKLSIQYLQHAVKNDPKNAKHLFDKVANTLTEQIENLSQIATSFSNFAKMPKPKNEIIGMKELVASVHLLFAENNTVDFQVDLPKEEYYVMADKNQLRRVLNNIISNAIQAIPDERRGRIGIFMFEKEENIVVKISDNGKGIPKEMHEKVFAPHFTTRSSGMGLGLAMCKDIVEIAGGKIYFKTQLDKGTAFFIELPKMEVETPVEVE